MMLFLGAAISTPGQAAYMLALMTDAVEQLAVKMMHSYRLIANGINMRCKVKIVANVTIVNP